MRLVVVVVTLLATTAARAEEAPVAVTLPDVLARVSSAPAAQVMRHEGEAAEALVAAARAWPDPSLRIEAHRLPARVVAGATIPLPVLGTMQATRRAVAAQAAVVRAEASVTRREVRLHAVTAWVSLARADGEVVAAATAASQAAELERIAGGRLDAGLGAEVDVSVARAARARAGLAAAVARRAQQAAAADLAGSLGWDPMRPLITAGPLPGREPILIELLRPRLQEHASRMAARRRVDAAEATIAQVDSQRRPGLAIEATVSALDPTTPGTDVQVALSLELPVFAHTGDRVRAARAAAAAERARLGVIETELGAGLAACYRRWQAASERVEVLENDVLPAQARAADLAAQAYREGARDLASALQANRDLTAVRAEVIAARADLAMAWADLHDVAGDELGGPDAR